VYRVVYDNDNNQIIMCLFFNYKTFNSACW